MGRRRKRVDGDMTSFSKPPILEEAPLDQFEEMIKSGLESVNLRILRKNLHNGQIQATNLTGFVVAVKDLYDLEQILRERLGGGVYIIEARHPEDRRPMCQKWYVKLEGLPKPADDVKVYGDMMMTAHGPVQVPSFMNPSGSTSTSPMPGVPPSPVHGAPTVAPTTDSMGRILPPPDLPKIYSSYPILEQWAIYEHLKGASKNNNPYYQVAPPAGASMYSDQAMAYAEQNTQRELMAAKASLSKAEERMAGLERELQSRLEIEKEKSRRAEIEAERAKHEADMRSLRAEIESAKVGSVKQSNPMETLLSFATAITPFVPVIQEMIRSGQSRDQLAIQNQQKQMELTIQTLTANSKKESDWTKLIPAVAPFFIQMLENRSPQALAEAQNLQMESSIAMTQFLSGLIKDHQGADQPWWMPMVERILNTVQQQAALKIGMASLPSGDDGYEEQQQHQQPQIPEVTAPSAPKMAAEPYQRDPGEEEWSRLSKIDRRSALITREIFRQLQPSLGFHTSEWKMIIFNLHLRRSSPEEMAIVLSEYLVHLRRFGKLPPIISSVFESPKEVLGKILGMLPVAKEDPEYIQKLIVTISAKLLPSSVPTQPSPPPPPPSTQQEMNYEKYADEEDEDSLDNGNVKENIENVI